MFITEALELIGYKRHLDRYGNTYADWDTTSRSDAQQSLAAITNFEFIVVFLTTYQHLSHLAGITVKLQKSVLDIIETYEQITKMRGRKLMLYSLKYLTKALELQIKLVALLECHALLQGNNIVVMLQLLLLVSISR